MKVTFKTHEQIEKMREAGRLAAEVLQVVAPYVKAGVTTAELDRICNEHIVNVQKAIPANVGYKGFPKTVCTSVNNVICHGIPSEAKVLKDGDILNIDVTVIKDGWHGDTSRMYVVGSPSVLAKRLIDVTREAMFRGIRMVRPGATLGDIGHAIQSYAEAERFSVVREYCGHGIGQIYHDEPNVLHYGQRGQGHTEAIGQGDHERHVDAEGLHQARVFGGSTKVGPQLGAFDQIPGGQADHQRGHDDPGPVFGQEHEAGVDHALKDLGHRIRHA